MNNLNISQEFNQCMHYILFRHKLKYMMNNQQNSNNNMYFDNNPYYLISQEWIRKWKHYINFPEINKKMKEKGKNYIDNKDYNWVQTIINESIQKNQYLEPLMNRVIYIYSEKIPYSHDYSFQIDPMEQFVIIDKESFSLFIDKNDKLEYDINKHPFVKAKFLFNKMIVKIDEQNYFISFKHESNIYYELCFNIEKILNNKVLISNLFKDIFTYDIKDWIQFHGGKINEPYFKINLQNNIYLEIKNKTIINMNKNIKENTIRPSLYASDNKIMIFKII